MEMLGCRARARGRWKAAGTTPWSRADNHRPSGASMSAPLRKTPLWLWLVGLSAVVGAAVVVWLHLKPSMPSSPDGSFPLPAYSASRFLNSGPEARYIGADACAECHREQHRSYLLTAHSQALSDLDPRAEPPDGAFEHRLSGR